MTTGFRVHAAGAKVPPALVERFKALPVANVSDVMSRMTAAGPRLRPMHHGGPLAGPALTVKTRPGDNLMIHKALDIAQPGDVVVVDAGGDLTNSLVGEMMITHAIVRGIAGIVLDGSIRDSAMVKAGRFPVFAAGISHRGPYKDGPGEINVAVAIDGMVIHPGDLVLGDDDGVLCVPRLEAEAIHAAALAKHAAEEAQLAAIRAGSSDRSWIDAALDRLGCERIDR